MNLHLCWQAKLKGIIFNRAGILSRDNYFLLLGVTTVSMIISPLLWSFTMGVRKSIENAPQAIDNSERDVLISFDSEYSKLE